MPNCTHCGRQAAYAATAFASNPYVFSLRGSQTTGDRNVCGSCVETHYTYCQHEEVYADNSQVETVGCMDRSGQFTPMFAAVHFVWNDSEDEYEMRGSEPRLRLQPYDADPFHHFSWDARNRSNALVFGVELEMEPKDSHSQHELIAALAPANSVGANFLLKSDGSLNNGVELVTMPFTLAQHLDNSGVPWKETLEKVYDLAHAGRDTSSCGIHIHINKKALSALTIGKMLVFLNSPELAPLMTTIAQRAASSYCRRSAKKLTDGTKQSESRYDMMNVSVRHPTCEVRMFNGNITVERVYKNIEFCHALVQYCRQSSLRTLADWGGFSQWLIAHRGEYKHLVSFLIDVKAVGFRQLVKDRQDAHVKVIDR